MRKLVMVILLASLCSTAWAAGDKRRAAELQRIEAAGRVMNEIMADRKSTRLNSSHIQKSRMPSSA